MTDLRLTQGTLDLLKKATDLTSRSTILESTELQDSKQMALFVAVLLHREQCDQNGQVTQYPETAIRELFGRSNVKQGLASNIQGKLWQWKLLDRRAIKLPEAVLDQLGELTEKSEKKFSSKVPGAALEFSTVTRDDVTAVEAALDALEGRQLTPKQLALYLHVLNLWQG